MKPVFETEGIPVAAPGNRPLLLNDTESVWLVESGKVDVFAVRVQNGDIAGSRAHIFRAEPGHLLFGIDNSVEAGGATGLIAVGAPGTNLLRLGAARFRELAARAASVDQLDGLVASWVGGLCGGARTMIMPKVWDELKSGEDISLAEGRNVRPHSGIVWVRHLAGASRLMGRKDLDTIDGANPYAIPVSSQGWLLTASESRLRCVDTRSAFLEDPSWLGLRQFHRLILRGIELNMEHAAADESQRLKAKDACDGAVFNRALAHIRSVMDPGDGVAPDPGEAEDPLLSACRMVGERMGVQITGPTAEAKAGRDPLEAVARASRIRMRRVALRDLWYRQDHGPLLAYSKEDGRPIALLPVSPGRYEAHDPASKTRLEVTPDVAETMASSAHVFYRPFPHQALKALDLLKFGLFGCLGDIWRVLAMAMMGAILGLITPIATGIIISRILPSSNLGDLGQITLILVTCALASIMFELTKAVVLIRLETRMDASMQAAVMDRLLSLPVPFFRGFTTGDLTERALAISEMRQIAAGAGIRAVLGGAFSSVNFLLLFYYDVKLAAIAAVVVLIGIAFNCAVNYRNIRHQRNASRIQGRISGLILQFATGITRLRVSGTEKRAFSIWAREFTQQKTIFHKVTVWRDILTTFNSTFPVLALMTIFASVAAGDDRMMSVGDFSAFNAAYSNFQNALLQVSSAVMTSLKLIPLYERSRPILEMVPEVDATKAAPGELTGDIEVNHIHFSYDPDGPQILRDVSFRVRPGEFVAFVGSSGSGKSTVLRLLLGFENQQSGSIYYDGLDLSTLDIREVRRQIGVVLQNSRVMVGDIFKNIVGSSTLTIEDAWEAARNAGLDEDIRQMPMGMHTLVSAGGGALSGGQRQRLMIARALVHKPRILFFDEATSALDNITQDIVSKSIEKLHATRVVIAHRLSTIMKADQIYVLDKGRIIQSGAYEELIQQEGLFVELARRQMS